MKDWWHRAFQNGLRIVGRQRTESKAERDAELLQRIIERKAANIGERKIAKELGISRGKLQSLLKKSKPDK